MNVLEKLPQAEQLPSGERKKAVMDLPSIVPDTSRAVQATPRLDEVQIQQVLRTIREIPETIEKTEEEKEVSPSEYIRIGKETLEKVNFQVLEGILSEKRRRSGVEKGNFFVDPKRIGISKAADNSVHGSFSVMFKRPWIQLQAGFWQMQKKKTEPVLRNNVLGALIHEETHASAKNAWFSKLKSLFATGYYAAGIRPNFLYFNEGVTDKIAEDVHREYLNRTGDKEYFGQGNMTEYPAGERYLGARGLVTASVEILAQATDIPSDKVWEALQQGYFTGIDLNETELKGALEEALFPGFVSKIKKGVKEESLPLKEIEKQAQSLPLSQEAQEKIAEAFEKYRKRLEKIQKDNENKSRFQKIWEKLSGD